MAVRFAERERALEFWRRLLERGIYTNLMLPPATPDGGSLVRASVTAAHTPEQIERIIDAFNALRSAQPAGVANAAAVG